MRLTLLSIFPEYFDGPLRAGLMGKAVDAGVVSFDLVNPRDFARDRHRSVDDTPYGGGPGMVMSPGPLAEALESVPEPGRMLYLDPAGRPLDQDLARELAGEENITLVCGRYEGIDDRVAELFPLERVSVGQAVLNGGEAAALCLVESVARLKPGFMGKQASGEEESFSKGLLEYPHYTRPETFRGLAVPEVLRSGDHARIRDWRRRQSLLNTLKRRPDLLAEARLDKTDIRFLRSERTTRRGRNLALALVHAPVITGERKVGSTSLTNLDLHDISRVSRSYGLRGLYVVTPLQDQRKLAETLISHWTKGAGGRANPDRAEAVANVRLATDLDEAIRDMAETAGRKPRVVATSARGAGTAVPEDVRRWLSDEPVLLLLGTGHGLAREVMERVDAVLRPLRPFDEYNHLSVRAAAAVTVDRILADIF
ncbi:tRNA (guanosine(37)-N1)-methyltransferase TrmD [Desulfohalovibrio reitneri]|uniref:tRNA (guanosine(37)-N1)-methyltransferase TrmD n=1 Tax=Desulfohalovibrio reitneri TaxID=1307759 RepID=UPI0004A73649|nr:tRNA (guanosine(37)-N1)-methyltransferase TrmD [Desulfohalovibrio reitneri]